MFKFAVYFLYFKQARQMVFPVKTVLMDKGTRVCPPNGKRIRSGLVVNVQT